MTEHESIRHGKAGAVGLALGGLMPPHTIPQAARQAEAAGFDELWLVEDYFLTGALPSAVAALAATERLPVGLAITSALVRHPAMLAMDTATIAHIYPERFWPGVGLGFPEALDQMGIRPKSDLRAMRECLTGLRALLAGDEVTTDGDVFKFDRIKLAYPLQSPVPLYMGGMGPKMLGVSGACADGTVTSVLSGVEYLHWARERIAEGQASAGRSGEDHRLVTLALFSVDDDGARALRDIRPAFAWYLESVAGSLLTQTHGIRDDVVALASHGVEHLAREMPDEWIRDLAVVGDPDECAAQIRRLLHAGADSVVLMPLPEPRTLEAVELAGRAVLPALRALDTAS